MTSPEPPSEAARGTSKRSPGIVAAIVIVVVLALAGGGFLVYKLTKSKDEPTPVLKVAKDVVAAIKAGDTAQLRTLSTGQGATQLLAFKPGDAGGVTMTAASCKVFGAKQPTRVCTATRPGGQLQLRMVFVSNAWKVNLATIGPAGLPPTSSTTAAT
jgi:hypothetical protein